MNKIRTRKKTLALQSVILVCHRYRGGRPKAGCQESLMGRAPKIRPQNIGLPVRFQANRLNPAHISHQQRGLGNTQWQIIQRLRPASVEDKLGTLRHFRFALCFENCVFPGYVTEKVFDCFLSGCVPIYLGAPDITDFIPK